MCACAAPSLESLYAVDMTEYDVQRCTRLCSVSGRELRPGETIYSALVEEGTAVVRRDFAREAWSGPPAGTIGWWKATVGDPQAGRMTWAPSEVMLDFFQRLADDPGAEDARYLMALLLVRRRILRQEEIQQDAAGRTVLVLYAPRTQTQYHVVEALPTPERAAAIQQQLAELLQTHGAASRADGADGRSSADVSTPQPAPGP